MVTTTQNKNLTPQETKCGSCVNQNKRTETCLDNFTPNQNGECTHYTGKIGQWLT